MRNGEPSSETLGTVAGAVRAFQPVTLQVTDTNEGPGLPAGKPQPAYDRMA